MKPGKVIAAALIACAIAPASALASTVQVTDAGQLRIEGAPGEKNQFQVLYQLAAEAGFEGVSDRIVVQDLGATPVAGSADCTVFDRTNVSCDARPIRSIFADL